jgi:peptidoglycan/LPS O-acetylase OafA/YrhL
MVAGIALFVAFLVIEPFRPELVTQIGLPLFLALRTVCLLFSAATIFSALPDSMLAVRRAVPKSANGYDPLLTLRAFAFILVLSGHVFAILYRPAQAIESVKTHGYAWMAMGSPWAGVWVFFVLSGYLMGKGFYSGRYQLTKGSVWDFYRRRLLRIAPIYYFALLVVAIFTAPEIMTLSNFWQVIALAVFSQQSSTGAPVIGALWSIQTEMAFYAMVPLLFMMLEWTTRRMNPLALLVVIVGLGIVYKCSVMAGTHGAGWTLRAYVPLIANIDLFLVGMLANWLVPAFARLVAKRDMLTAGVIYMVPFYSVTAYVFAHASFGAHPANYMVLALYVGPTLVCIATLLLVLMFEAHLVSGARSPAATRWFIRGTQIVGVLTYPLYVWHEPIFTQLRKAYPAEIGWRLAIEGSFIALVITTIVAYGSWRLIEAPFEKKKPNIPPEALHPEVAREN